jgi:septum formation protein
MLQDKLKQYKLILASGSPRRQQFLKIWNWILKLKEVEEIFPPHLKREEITNFLAELKAGAFEGGLQENEI